METLRRQVKEIKSNQDILNKAVQNLIQSIVSIEKKVDIHSGKLIHENEDTANQKYIEEAMEKVANDIKKIDNKIQILEFK
jgi:CRISPR/Cas system CSM-associated protein Csm5 (group 7 of RAMP superfamily)